MGTFDLTSTLDPTDEQLQALMEGIGEIGRRSSANAKFVLDRLMTLTFTPADEITEEALNGLPIFAKDLIREIHHI